MSCLNNMDDRLSMLPDEIVTQILSLMSMKSAVQTSILSKRWRRAWTLVTNLEFDDNHDFQNLSKIVDQVMEFYAPSSIHVFRVHIVTSLVRESCVSDWIDQAVRLNVRELDIDVFKFTLPLSMFTCKTLTKLRLNHGKHDKSVWEFPSLVYLPCLKTLDIIVYTNPSINAFKLIYGCPMLESLSLEVNLRGKHEEDYIFNIPTLKRLKVTLQDSASVINKVVLRLPNLEYLFIGGTLCSNFVAEDVSSLVEACVSFVTFDHSHLWVDLLKGLSGVKSLLVQKVPYDLRLPIFPNMKHLELKKFWHSKVVIPFLESCPELKHLYTEEKEAFRWVGSKVAPACMLTSLTTIKFTINKWWMYDIPFLEYMLGNAKVLKTITITWKYSENNIQSEKQLYAKLLSLPRASRFCEIHFHGTLFHSTSS